MIARSIECPELNQNACDGIEHKVFDRATLRISSLPWKQTAASDPVRRIAVGEIHRSWQVLFVICPGSCRSDDYLGSHDRAGKNGSPAAALGETDHKDAVVVA